MSKFPNVIAAAEALQQHKDAVEGRDLWALGDALIKDCGKPSGVGESDGSRQLLEKATEELARHGYEYTAGSLVQIRQTAFDFPKVRRLTLATFWVHCDAGSPDMLDAIAARAKREKVNVTARYVRDYVQAIRDRQLEEAAKKRGAAKERVRAAEEKGRKASTLEEKRAARKEEDEAREEISKIAPVVRRNLVAPTEDDMSLIGLELQLSGLAREAISAAKKAQALLEKGGNLKASSVDFLTDSALSAANLWTGIGQTIRGATTARGRGHLHVVGE